MAAIYILSDRGKLSRKDETLVFTQPDETRTILFPFKTEHLVIMGNVSISGDALRLLMKYKIDTTFLSPNGSFNGKLSFGDGKNVFLRQKQYRILDDAAASLEIARSIVTGKIRNEISFMQRIKRKGLAFPAVESAIAAVKQALADAERAEDVDRLRGYEGIAARRYFEVFGLNIQPEWAEFKTRSKNPPRSNVNAVLSFLYTLLMYRVGSAIESQGLDACVGNLHAVNYGKSALVFDLMEEFRSPIADSLCCSLFNLGTLREDDFEAKDFSGESQDYPLAAEPAPPDASSPQEDADSHRNVGVLLTKPALKKVIAAFESKMDSQILYPPAGHKLAYKRVLYEQVEHYRRVVGGEESEYRAYYFK